jgi:LysR substrate binding domain
MGLSRQTPKSPNKMDRSMQWQAARPGVGDWAALAGLGIASLPLILSTEEIATSRLVRVLEDWNPRSAEIYAIYADKKHIKRSVRLFIESLRRLWPDGGDTLPARQNALT